MLFTSLDAMVEQMRMITSRKAAKTYSDCAGLVVHLNPPMFSFNPKFHTEVHAAGDRASRKGVLRSLAVEG